MAAADAVRALGLVKHYGPVVALDGIDLAVGRGELYGFMGRNGAGKTTTIRLLLGMIHPTAGRVEILGRPVSGGLGEDWGRVGHLVEHATAYPELTVRENLEVARRLQGSSDPGAVNRELDRMALGAYADRRVRTLSTGNLQRLALARALLHGPELVVLDEPTVGLDPAGVVEVRGLLRSLAEGGVTVFMSSHILTEVDRIATRVGIVHRGRLVAELSGPELAKRRGRRLEVETRDPVRAAMALERAGYAPSRRGPRIELTGGRALDRPDDVATVLVQAGCAPTRLAVVQQDMESFFLSLTGDAHDPAAGGAAGSAQGPPATREGEAP